MRRSFRCARARRGPARAPGRTPGGPGGARRAGRRDVSTRWGAAVAVPLVMLLPIVRWGLHQRQAQLHWVPPVTAGQVYTFPARMFGNAETAWLLIGLALAALRARRSRSVVEVLAAAVVPPALVVAVSVAGQ